MASKRKRPRGEPWSAANDGEASTNTKKTSGPSQPASRPMIDEILQFVRHDDVEAYMQLGWQPTSIDGGLIGTPHGVYSIIMVWPCQCPLRRPQR